jgi:hypothetical protein
MSSTNKPRQNSTTSDLTIILQCCLAAFIVCMTFYVFGMLGAVAGFNFFVAAFSILLAAVSLKAKKEWLIRSIAVAGMVITMASVFVSPPWAAAPQSNNAAPVSVPSKAD